MDTLSRCVFSHLKSQFTKQLKFLKNYFSLFWTLQDDDTISQKSYGSHKIRSFKDESHKGSADTIDGEEKKDASKEELGLEEGTISYNCLKQQIETYF